MIALLYSTVLQFRNFYFSNLNVLFNFTLDFPSTLFSCTRSAFKICRSRKRSFLKGKSVVSNNSNLSSNSIDNDFPCVLVPQLKTKSLLLKQSLCFFPLRFKSCYVNLIVFWTVSALTKATQLAFRPLGKRVEWYVSKMLCFPFSRDLR